MNQTNTENTPGATATPPPAAPQPKPAASKPPAQPAKRPAPAAPMAGDASLDRILDVPVNASLEVGRKSISIRELLALDEGSIMEFDRAVDQPVDFLVNGTLVARGEIVLVGEKFGLRLTEVVDTSRRIMGLA